MKDPSAGHLETDDAGSRLRPAVTPGDAEAEFTGPADARPVSTALCDYVEACLMLALGERPAYGYLLKGELADLGLPGIERGRIYRALRSMEAEGLVVSHWETVGSGPARRTYELTPGGHQRLRAQALAVRRQRRDLSRFLSRYERVRPAESDAVA